MDPAGDIEITVTANDLSLVKGPVPMAGQTIVADDHTQ